MPDKAVILESITAGINQRLSHITGVLRRAGLSVSDNVSVYALGLTESDYTHQARTDLTVEEALDRAIRILKARSPGTPTARLDAAVVAALAFEIMAAYDVLADRALRAEQAATTPPPEEAAEASSTVEEAAPEPEAAPAPVEAAPEPEPAPVEPKPRRARKA